jgi:hypothetical protein
LGVKRFGEEMNTIDRLEKILVSPRLRVASKAFVESMLAQAKSKDLSAKQLEYVEKFWDECFPPAEIVEAEEEWKNSFTPEMRDAITIMGQYYEYHYPNSRMAKNYKDENWIPEKAVYEKSCDSQWAKTTIKNYQQAFRFAVGDTIQLRDTQRNRSYFKTFMDSPLLVLEQVKNVKNNFVNYYTVIPLTHMDDQKTYEVKEDALNVINTKKVKNG